VTTPSEKVLGSTFARAEDDGLSRDRVKIHQNFIRDGVRKFFTRKIFVTDWVGMLSQGRSAAARVMVKRFFSKKILLTS